jgi:putative ABC transport system ATP-binding protein
MEKVVEVKDLRKVFKVGGQDVEVLKGVTFDIKKGDFLVIIGPSGCGKSTTMNIALGLEEPTSGSVNTLGYTIDTELDQDSCGVFRKNNVGVVYQQSHWVKSLSVRENVALPLLLMGKNRTEALVKSMQMLKLVGMVPWSDYVPTELSSGQQQRVALARAMINDPKIIFADEPTGNLDNDSGTYIMGVFKKLNKENDVAVVMVTHDLEYLPYANRAIRMGYGNIEEEYTSDKFEELIPSVLMPFTKTKSEKEKAKG